MHKRQDRITNQTGLLADRNRLETIECIEVEEL